MTPLHFCIKTPHPFHQSCTLRHRVKGCHCHSHRHVVQCRMSKPHLPDAPSQAESAALYLAQAHPCLRSSGRSLNLRPCHLVLQAPCAVDTSSPFREEVGALGQLCSPEGNSNCDLRFPRGIYGFCGKKNMSAGAGASTLPLPLVHNPDHS